MIIEGGEEAWILSDRLAERGVPVIMTALENRPTQVDRLATRFEGPGLLAAAGVPVIITTGNSHRVANVTHEAGNAVRYGMDHAAALRAVTLEPARAFGLDDLGSLEAGKIANVVIWSDDPFEFSGYAERVFINGREIEMESRQRLLFERYRRTP
jgi:imidazolonepropionase-like amidohydrolase